MLAAHLQTVRTSLRIQNTERQLRSGTPQQGLERHDRLYAWVLVGGSGGAGEGRGGTHSTKSQGFHGTVLTSAEVRLCR